MKILLTGASGYLGKQVIKYYLSRQEEDIKLFAVGNAEKLEWSGIPVMDIDLFDEGASQRIFNQFGRIDTLIHLAWRDGFKLNSMNHINNFPLHVNFISSLYKLGVKNINVMGSMLELGRFEGLALSSSPCLPTTLYGISKTALLEVLLKTNLYEDASIKWLRGFYFIGENSEGNSVFSKLYRAATRGDKIFNLTSGKNKFDFLDVREAARQIFLASIQNEVTGVINICSGMPITLREKIESFTKDQELEVELVWNSFPERPDESSIIYGDKTEIDKILSRVKGGLK